MIQQTAALTINIAPSSQGNSQDNTVQLHSDRPVLAANYFIGKSVDETLRLLPMLFSVCSKAQACASVRGFECALNQGATADMQRQRQIAVDVESLREHLWRIFLQWPQLLGSKAKQPMLAEVFRLQRALDAQLNPNNQLFTINAKGALQVDSVCMKQLKALVDLQVFGSSCEQWLAITDLSELSRWQKDTDTSASQLLNAISDKQWQSAGDGGYSPLPELTPAQQKELQQLMAQDGFIAQPTWHNQSCESTPLTRNQSPLLEQCQQHFGTGLFTRAIAMLTEVANLAANLLRWFRYGHSGPAGEQSPTWQLGHAVAARGQLFHSVQCQNNTVTDYRILAPTEWNFHPMGVVKAALGQLQGSPNALKLQAQLFIELLDPCVAYSVSTHHGVATGVSTHA